MHISTHGIDFIKKCEGCSLSAYAYQGNILAIGYGHRGADVAPGLTISQRRAHELLLSDIRSCETAINSCTFPYIRSFAQNQFDALVAFTYNMGEAPLRQISSAANADDMALRMRQFGGPLRDAEADLFLFGPGAVIFPRKMTSIDLAADVLDDGYGEGSEARHTLLTFGEDMPQRVQTHLDRWRGKARRTWCGGRCDSENASPDSDSPYVRTMIDQWCGGGLKK